MNTYMKPTEGKYNEDHISTKNTDSAISPVKPTAFIDKTYIFNQFLHTIKEIERK
jgi:hypothetical protein